MSKRAVILAGGKGTRLKPYTISLPKPLVPIGEKPILEIIIQKLAKAGFDHITISINHMAEMIREYFSDGSKWGVKIDYSMEEMPLSTMGPLKLIKDLPEDFLVMNGDVLTDLDFENFYNEHVVNNNIFTISAFNREQMIDYGVLMSDNANQLVDFVEKPVTTYQVSMGIYILNRRALDFIPENKFFGFDHLMLSLIKHRVYATVRLHRGNWLDIGRPDDYKYACTSLQKNKWMH